MCRHSCLIPERNFKTILPGTKKWCGMVIKAGPFCLFYKGDLHDAFRQLGLANHCWPQTCYILLDTILMDTHDIYGTKSGSKHTQYMGEMIVAAFLIWIRQFMH